MKKHNVFFVFCLVLVVGLVIVQPVQADANNLPFYITAWDVETGGDCLTSLPCHVQVNTQSMTKGRIVYRLTKVLYKAPVERRWSQAMEGYSVVEIVTPWPNTIKFFGNGTYRVTDDETAHALFLFDQFGTYRVIYHGTNKTTGEKYSGWVDINILP